MRRLDESQWAVGGLRPTNCYAAVDSDFQLPFQGYPFQRHAVDELAWLPRSGLYHEPGLGKTFVSTCCALFQRMLGAETTVVLMPPILLQGWNRFLSTVRHGSGAAMDVLVYRGTPRERKSMRLRGHDFVLMSMQIFKQDYARILEELGPHKVHVINDEATSVKNPGSQNYKKFRDFVPTLSFQLLTGTPMNKIEDAYAYIKLISPGVYASMHQFASVHIAEVDFFGKPTAYQNLEHLQRNLLLNSDRKIKEEVLLDLPRAIVNPIHYDLAPAHAKLYRTLAEEQMLKFADGTKLDATSVSALWNALQQIILNWGHFGADPTLLAAGLDLIQETLDEIGDKKLMVFANYRMSNRLLSEKFHHVGAVGIWGDVSAKQKDAHWERFLTDPACRMIHLQPAAAGLGLDGAQHVCSDVLYIECPLTPTLYQQSMSRVYRDGQRLPVNVRIAVAQGTVQARTLKTLTERQDLVTSVQGGIADLRAAVFGE